MSMQAHQPQGVVGFISHFAKSGLLVSTLIGLWFWQATGDWVVIPAMICIWLFWRAFPSDEAPPGLQFSFSYHLFQIIAGVLYTAFTQRYLSAHDAPQYHLMMLLATGSIMAIFAGFLVGDRWLAKIRRPIPRITLDVTLKQLFIAYVLAVMSSDVLGRLASSIPIFGQAIHAISAAQAGLLYLVLRRLFREERYLVILPILLFETARGFTGYYSGFKEPVILALIAAMEVFQPRKVTHWSLIAVLVASVLSLSVLWLGIRGQVRTSMDIDSGRPAAERLRFALEETQIWWRSDTDYKMYDVDALADRIWDIYYTALALDRVPSTIPHQDGAILSAAVQHVLTPRFLNPDKAALPSESEDVYRYTGLKVAGREEATTIAFGYVIQAYIDYGIPMMFIPSILFGLFMGGAYRWFMTTIRHEEILIAVLAIGFWLNVMPYNTSWAKMLGKLLTSLVYVGGVALILDRVLYTRRLRAEQYNLPITGNPVRTH